MRISGKPSVDLSAASADALVGWVYSPSLTNSDRLEAACELFSRCDAASDMLRVRVMIALTRQYASIIPDSSAIPPAVVQKWSVLLQSAFSHPPSTLLLSDKIGTNLLLAQYQVSCLHLHAKLRGVGVPFFEADKAYFQRETDSLKPGDDEFSGSKLLEPDHLIAMRWLASCAGLGYSSLPYYQLTPDVQDVLTVSIRRVVERQVNEEAAEELLQSIRLALQVLSAQCWLHRDDDAYRDRMKALLLAASKEGRLHVVVFKCLNDLFTFFSEAECLSLLEGLLGALEHFVVNTENALNFGGEIELTDVVEEYHSILDARQIAHVMVQASSKRLEEVFSREAVSFDLLAMHCSVIAALSPHLDPVDLKVMLRRLLSTLPRVTDVDVTFKNANFKRFLLALQRSIEKVSDSAALIELFGFLDVFLKSNKISEIERDSVQMRIAGSLEKSSFSVVLPEPVLRFFDEFLWGKILQLLKTRVNNLSHFDGSLKELALAVHNDASLDPADKMAIMDKIDRRNFLKSRLTTGERESLWDAWVSCAQDDLDVELQLAFLKGLEWLLKLHEKGHDFSAFEGWVNQELSNMSALDHTQSHADVRAATAFRRTAVKRRAAILDLVKLHAEHVSMTLLLSHKAAIKARLTQLLGLTVDQQLNAHCEIDSLLKLLALLFQQEMVTNGCLSDLSIGLYKQLVEVRFENRDECLQGGHKKYIYEFVLSVYKSLPAGAPKALVESLMPLRLAKCCVVDIAELAKECDEDNVLEYGDAVRLYIDLLKVIYSSYVPSEIPASLFGLYASLALDKPRVDAATMESLSNVMHLLIPVISQDQSKQLLGSGSAASHLQRSLSALGVLQGATCRLQRVCQSAAQWSRVLASLELSRPSLGPGVAQ